MPTIVQSTQGFVTALWGRASIRGADGKMRALKVGDPVHPGDVILTTQDGIVEIRPQDGGTHVAQPAETPGEIDRVISAVDLGDSSAAPAAGLAGGDGNLQEGLRVDRIQEAVGGALPVRVDGSAAGVPFVEATTVAPEDLQAETPATPPNAPPVATPATASGAEDSPISVSLGGTDPDGRIVGVTVTGIPPGGTLTLADGTPVTAGQTLSPTDAAGLVFHPPAGFNGSATITFTVTDDDGTVSTPGAVAVTVTPVNDPPVADVGLVGSGAEDTAVEVHLGGFDRDGTVVSVTVTTLPTHGVLYRPDGVTPVAAGAVLTPTEAANLVFVPEPDYHGTTTLSFSVTDNEGAVSAPSTVGIRVTPVNDAPVAADDSATLSEDTPAGGNVLDNDRDVDGPTLVVKDFSVGGRTYVAGETATIPGVGTLTIAADGTWTFTPARDFHGSVPPILYTATDGSAESTATLTLGVTPANDAPVAVDDIASTPVGQTVTITPTANDRDVDGDPVTLTGATLVDPTRGTLTVHPDGTLSFQPAEGVTGPVVISYTITDPSGATDTAQITVNVGANAPPTGADATRTLAEDGRYTVGTADFGFADADAGQTLANVRIDTLPAAGTLRLDGVAVVAGQVISAADIAAGRLVFAPAANGSGSGYASFGFSVQDSLGAYDAAPNTLRFDVTPANDAPVARDDRATATEDTPATGNVLRNDTDVDGDRLEVTQFSVGGSTYTAGQTATLAGVGSLSIAADGGWRFVPAADYHGPVPTATYTVSDGSTTDTARLTITLAAANDAPVARNDTATLGEDTPATGNVLDNDRDADGDALAVTQFSVGGSTYTAGQTATLDGVGTLTIAADGSWRFEPAANYHGPVPVATYTVSDGTATDTGTLALDITPANDAPVARNDAATVDEDRAVVIDVLRNDRDVDGDALTVTQVAGQPITVGSPVTVPEGTVVLNADGTLTFTPKADYHGSVAFGYTVSDGHATSSATVTVEVSPANDAPVAGDDLASTPINTPIASIDVLANDRDVDGDTLTVTGATLADPALGRVGINADGTLSFTPGADVTGPVVITYTVSDGHGGTDTATVTVTVGPNNPPDGADRTLTIAEDSRRSFSAADFGFTDADAGQTLANVRIDTLPAAGTLTLAGVAVAAGDVIAAADLALLEFAPAPNANGVGYARFGFSVQDSAGAFDTAPNTITIDVTPVADPAAVGGVATGATVEDTTLATGGQLSVTDPDAGEAGFQPRSGVAGAHGTFSIDADGRWTYTLDNADPAVQALGSGERLPDESFTVTTIDGTTQVVTVSITGVNDGAVVSVGTGDVTEDTNVVAGQLVTGGTLTVTDTDAGESGFRPQAATAGAYGSFTLAADGTWSYTASNTNPAVQALGNGNTLTETFTVRSTDGTSSTVVVTIHGVNDAAVLSADTGTVVEDGPLTTGGQLTIADVDGPETFVAQSGTPGAYGSFSVDADGLWAYTLDNALPVVQALGPADTLSETFTVGAADGTSTTVVITIRGANDAAVLSAGTGSVTEDVGVVDGNLVTGGTLTVVDPDAGESSFQAQAGTPGLYGSFSLSADGTWSYTASNAHPTIQSLATGDTLTETFTVRSADGSRSTVVVTIHGTSDTAVISAGTGAVTEDVGVVGGDLVTGGTLTVVDPDAGEAAFQPQAGTAGLYGSFTLTTDGSWSYTASNANPAIQALGDGDTLTETFTVRSADGTRSSVVVTIHGTNDGPVANGDGYATAEDVALSITASSLLANDTDLDGDALTVTSVQGAVNGTVSLVGGNVVFTPAANYSGPASFTYTVSDGHGGRSTATVNVTVNPVNDPPVAADTTVSTNEDTVIRGSLPAASDVDGDTVSYALGSAAGHGTVVVNADGSYTYTPAANYNGPDSFTYTVSDGQGGSNTYTVGVTVNPVNDAPVAADTTVSTNEDTVIRGSLPAASDADGDTVTYALGSAAGHGTVVVNADGSYTYTPAANYNGPDSFTYTVSDGQGGSNTYTVGVTVSPVNDPPVAVADTFRTDEDTPVTITLASLLANDTDADGDALRVVSAFGATHGSISIVAGNIVFTPDANFSGQGSFSYTITDGKGGSATGTAFIDVAPLNDPPVAADTTVSTNEDTVIRGSLPAASDADGDTVTYALGSAASHGTVVVNADGSYTYTPAANYNGPDTFTYTVSDGQGGSNTYTVGVTVNPVNDPPVAAADTFRTDEDTPVTITLASLLANDTDADGDALRVVSAFGATHGSISIVAGNIVFTPDANFSGQGSFSYTITDGKGGSSTGTAFIDVAPLNDAPVAAADAVRTNEDTPVTIAASTLLANDTDPDGDALTVTSVQGAVNGTASLVGGNVVFTPAGNYSGPASFTYTVSDGHGGTSTATVNVTVDPVNDAPTATGGAVTGTEDTALVIGWASLGVGDVDSSTLSIQLTALPADGTVQFFNGSTWVSASAGQVIGRAEIDAGRLRFVPDANESGDGSFAAGGVGNKNQDYARLDFRPYDGNSFGAPATLRIDIQPVADAPTLSLNPVPPSVGLVLQYYDNVPTVGTNNAGNTSVVEANVEATPPTSTSAITNVAVASIGVDDAYRVSGYIYLEAGHSYTLSGYRDDTLRAEIGGTTVFDVGYNNWGSFNASGFTPTVSGYYSLEIVAYNGSGPGSLDLNLSVDGGAAVDLSTANFSLYPDSGSLTAGGTAVGSFVANGDGGYFPRALSGPEDQFIRLGSLGVTQTDTDGSETLALRASGLQVGGTLTDGVRSFDATAGNTTVDLGGWDLANLQYRAPRDFNGSTSLTLTATTTEPNGSTASATLTLPITVIPVNDPPVGVNDNYTVVEGSVGVQSTVLANDTDIETRASGVFDFASAANGAAVVANGVNTITTQLGGTVVMNADGTFRYFAPVVNHGLVPASADSFAYRPSDGTDTGNWTTVRINLTDTDPTARPDAATVAWGSAVSGNLLTNDVATDASKAIVSVNGVGVPGSGTAAIALDNGTLQVAADGSFTYTSNVPTTGTATGTSETAWRGSVAGLWGFTDNAWANGSKLNLPALGSQPDLVNYQGGSKPGLEVGNSGIQFGESMLVHLSEAATSVTVGMNQLNASQPASTWFAYDATGALVASGNFSAGPANGSLSLQTFSAATPFEYLRFGNSVSGGQGYLLTSIEYNRLPESHDDTFSYTMRDTDGDLSTTTVTITPGATSSFVTRVPNGTAAGDHITGSSGDDQIQGLGGDDQLFGQTGQDTLVGDTGNDRLFGGLGNDTLSGGGDQDILIGGAGTDRLTGGGGADVFTWTLSDRASGSGLPTDTVVDFNTAAPSAGGDLLDLRDLLQGEARVGNEPGNLAQFLDFDTTSSAGSTIIRISSSGGFTGGAYNPTAEDQRIVLQGVDVRDAAVFGLNASSTDNDIIQQLLARGKLLADGA